MQVNIGIFLSVSQSSKVISCRLDLAIFFSRCTRETYLPIFWTMGRSKIVIRVYEEFMTYRNYENCPPANLNKIHIICIDIKNFILFVDDC